MQQHALLQTKLFVPPPRPELVSRSRLIQQLNAGLHRKLTLVSAPAGFGKTTLLSEWVAASDELIAWVSLDEGDNDVVSFLAYLVAALQMLPRCQVEGDIGAGVLEALRSPQPPPTESILIALINQIAALPERIVLVLDDYHLIEAQPIHDALSFLLEHMPRQMHLVISTRSDPFFPLSRLRARNQLTELRGTDLRFSSSEAADFLKRVMGLDLSEEDIAALETRTEGWIAGLQLAAISLKGHDDTTSLIKSFTGSHRLVLDYLIEEVLEQQSASVQAFLLQTAILDRLTGSLCDAVRFGRAKSPSSSAEHAVRFGRAKSPGSSVRTAVRLGYPEAPTDQDSGQEILEMLERANLFIVPLDNERHWYRYHHLFADLLRQRLRRTQSEWEPTLHRRASEWYEQNGFVGEAIEHASIAEDFERAAHLIEEHVDDIWLRGEHAKLRLWLDGLPVDVIHSKASLCLFHAWYLFTGGNQDAAEVCIQAAEQALDASTDLATDSSPLDRRARMSDSDRLELRGRAAVIQAFMATYIGDIPAIIRYARQALEYLPKQDLAWRSIAALALGDAQGFKGDLVAAYQARLEAAEASRSAGNVFFSILAYLKVAVTLRELGQLQRTIEICQQQLQLADTSGLSQTSVAGGLLAIWGEVLAELGDLEGAIGLTKRGVELAERAGETAILGWSYLCLTRALFSGGDTAAAESIVRKVEDAARESSLPPWITGQMAAWQARLWLAQDNLAAASKWPEARGLLDAGDPQPLQGSGFFSLNDHVMLARILIAQERLEAAIRLLRRLLEAAEAGGRTSRAIEIVVLQALALQAGGDKARAIPTLERALILADSGGFVRIFVDEGPAMARLLYEVATRDVIPDHARRLLAAFPVAEDETTRPRKPEGSLSEIVEPLSERELEVLQLIGEGLTNREIATRLFISLNTVKAHTRNVYGKLNVHSRTQAIARSRELGLLPRRKA